MQELKLIIAESDHASLVLRGVESGTEFFLPVTTELCDLLRDANPAPATEVTEDSEAHASQTSATVQALSSVVDADASNVSSADATESADSAEETILDAEIVSESQDESADGAETTAAGSSPTSDTSVGDAPSAETAAENTGTSAETSAASSSTEVAKSGSSEVEKKRRHRIKINMSPRTIQDRVRHGASVAELAKEADTDEARIEPYAWPILQERGRIAELAHTAHPVLADGPTKQTLWEVLATALAARGATLSDATWDAYQDQSRRWLISVEWEKEAAGQTSTHQAEFIYEKCTPGPDLAHANNSVASDLIDPRYGQPVRRMAAVTPLLGGPQGQEDDYSEYDQYDDQGDPTGAHPQAGVGHNDNGQRGLDALIGGNPNQGQGGRGQQQQRGGHNGDQQPRGLHDRAGGAEDDTNEFLLHPNTEERKPSKRKRKAVTPHWEDVLLGVRTNPRKKK